MGRESSTAADSYQHNIQEHQLKRVLDGEVDGVLQKQTVKSQSTHLIGIL